MEKVQDEAYWSQYYKMGAAPDMPSLFARYVVINYVKDGHELVELGCGNGRDARFLATGGAKVEAVDQCAAEIRILADEAKAAGQDNLSFTEGDFTNMHNREDPLDIVYSRFTLHSVTAEGQNQTLNWAYTNLKDGGKICIETRGQRNEYYKLGEAVEGQEDAFVYEGHYRRFVEFENFITEIKSFGFAILEASEDVGFAPYRDTDHHFIRVIAEK